MRSGHSLVVDSVSCAEEPRVRYVLYFFFFKKTKKSAMRDCLRDFSSYIVAITRESNAEHTVDATLSR